MFASPKSERPETIPGGPQYRKRTDPGKIGFIPQLESIRGIGALMVAALHAGQSHTTSHLTLVSDPRSWTNPLWSALFSVYRLVSNGRGALIVFFVLSGFVLASSIERGPHGVGPAARHFFIGRVFRLYPAIIFAVLLFSLAYWLTGAFLPGATTHSFSLTSIVRNMLLIDTNIDGVMWSLQVEALAIPLIFAVTIGRRGFGEKFVVVMMALFFALSWWPAYQDLLRGRLVLLYTFIFGIATHSIGPHLIQRIGRGGVPWLVAATLVLFFMPRAVLGVASKWAPLCECLSAVGMIAVIVYGGKSTLAQILNWPLFRFYGRISYSFYLLHPLTLLVIWTIPAMLSGLIDAGVAAVVVAISLTILSTLVITPLAWLSWRFIEIPGIATGRRLSPDRRNASPYVSPRGQVVHVP